MQRLKVSRIFFVLSVSSGWRCALERKSCGGKQMLNGLQQVCNRMAIGRCAQVLRGDMQVNLSAGDLPMSQKISNGDNVCAGTNQVCSECMSQSMWRYRL